MKKVSHKKTGQRNQPFFTAYRIYFLLRRLIDVKKPRKPARLNIV
jgi:hypothetical protein